MEQRQAAQRTQTDGSAGAAGRDGAFARVAVEEIYQGYVIRVTKGRFRAPGGEEFTRDVIYSPGAVGIVAVHDGPDGPETLLVRQFRPAIEDWLLEIPAGLRDKPGEDPAETAARELIEETGYRAERFHPLTVFLNAAGMTDQRTHVYLATELTHVGAAADGVEEQYLELVRVPLREVRPMIERGELIDAKTIIGLRLALDHLGW
ncbi:MAG: NUDIX hydrolase [Acidimicrobiia bacterium]